MYDNLRLMMSEPFRSETEREGFISRFALFVKDEKKGIYHNKGYETLSQNKGIYIRFEVGTGLGRGRIVLCFSLHKFYNAMRTGRLFNYNRFGFDEATEASRMLCGLLGLDLSEAVVKKYEIGINIHTEKPPETYMRELDFIGIKGRQYRIIEDRKHKEYKLYGTHSEKGKRIVYLFYDKTYEARSKLKDETRRLEVPENILRVEIDVQRPTEKILFSRLFDPVYQSMLKREFRQRFTCDLHYKELPVKLTGLTGKQMEVYRYLCEMGETDTIEYYRSLWKRKFISRDQYRYAVSTLATIQQRILKLPVSISPEATFLLDQMRRILS